MAGYVSFVAKRDMPWADTRL